MKLHQFKWYLMLHKFGSPDKKRSSKVVVDDKSPSLKLIMLMLSYLSTVPCPDIVLKTSSVVSIFAACLIPSMYLSYCLARALFPSIILRRHIFSRPFHVNTCPWNPNCLFFFTVVSSLFVPAICITSWFVLFAVNRILVILLRNQTPAASSLLLFSLLIVQLSQP